MFKTLTRTLGIPQQHVTVLRSLSKHRYPATAFNIEDSLKSAADNIGPDGILFFYFSGLVIGYEGGNKKALIPADYAGVISSVITIDRIASSLTSLKDTDKQIVVILDCCSSAHVAKQLNTFMGIKGYNVCAVAACSDAESAYTFPSLQASFFTFFFHRFLTMTPPHKRLPLKAICDYCSPVCNALAGLAQHDSQPSNLSMHPTVISVLRIETVGNSLRVRPVLDETDGSALSGDRFAKTLGLLQYQAKEDFTGDMNWSREVCKWMQNKVQNLWVLKNHDVLREKKVMETVCCLIMHSIAMKAVTEHQDLAFRTNTPIISYFRVVEFIADFEPSVMYDMDSHVVPAIQHYVKVLHQYLKTDKEIQLLVGLYRALSQDQEAHVEEETDGPLEAADFQVLHENTIPCLPVGIDDLP
jgi:hypothetical protein